MAAGFLLGSRETLLETMDGGKTWSPRSIAAARDEGEACPMEIINPKSHGMHACMLPVCSFLQGKTINSFM
jgi:hypothetical protein